MSYVFRDPVDAYINGVLPRSKSSGRIVPVDTHMSTHQNSLKAFREISAIYSNDRQVFADFYVSSEDGIKLGKLEDFSDIDYNRAKEKILLELETRYRNGEISRQVYDSATGRDEPGGNRGGLGEPERSGTGSDETAQPESQNAANELLPVSGRAGIGREESSNQSQPLSPEAADASLQIAAQQIAEGRDVSVEAIADYGAGRITAQELAQKLSKNQVLLNELEKNRLQEESLSAEPKAETQIEIENDIQAREQELNTALKDLEQSEAAQRFSESTTTEMARREISDAFGQDGQKLLDIGRIRLVDQESDLPGSHKTGTIGYVDKNGTAYLVLENMEPGTVKPLVLHELGAHDVPHKRGDKPVGAGHKNSYYKEAAHRRFTENFANLFNTLSRGENSLDWKLAQRFAPNSARELLLKLREMDDE